jgi:hypothetical protein
VRDKITWRPFLDILGFPESLEAFTDEYLYRLVPDYPKEVRPLYCVLFDDHSALGTYDYPEQIFSEELREWIAIWNSLTGISTDLPNWDSLFASS